MFVQKDCTAAEKIAIFYTDQLIKAIRPIDSSLKIRNGNSFLYINDEISTWANGAFDAPCEAGAVIVRSMAV